MASQKDRLTQRDGQGVTIKRSGKPAAPEHTRHFVGADHVITEAEALEMGRALFDAIASEQARVARASRAT